MNSLAIQLQTLNSQNARVFFSWFQTSKNVAAQRLCCGVVAVKIPRKLTCDGWFCNVVGCKTQISIELGCSPERFTWKVERKQCWRSQLIKVTN